MKAAAPCEVLQWRSGGPPKPVHDYLAVEEPLEIQIDTRPVSVTMRTPGHDEELAAGFLFSEGLITSRTQIASIVPYPRNEAGNAINVLLQPEVAIDFGRLTRHLFASSSCGLCGKATIQAVHQHFPPVDSALEVDSKVLLTLPDKLRAVQSTFDETGGLHAAGLFSVDGELLVAREDVGRHNAVDKVLGYALLQNLALDRHILMVSGRASFEILQKSLAAKIPVLAAVSAPSSLAVEFARESRQTLVGFLRAERMNIYSHPDRVKFG
ncbi:MAG: Protein fdhD [Verrucomicrobiales bacterium]|nr:Protein fdhD [Verrucomicrobiales bacterium]